MALTAAQVEQQRKQAEELLFSGPQTLGFAKGLFFGRFNAPLLFPYPTLTREQAEEAERAVAEVRRFCDEHIDAAAIDRDADIPPEVVAGLGRLGVLGMTAPKEYGGRGLSQLAYTRVMEVIGGHDAGVAVFVNAHHSIGIRALLLFGTEEQKRRWLPPLVSGEQLAAFALTEPEAGSDASNVQTTATPTADGAGLRPQRDQALHHQRRHRQGLDRDGADAGGRGGQEEGDHRLSGHAGHARFRGGGGADAEAGHPRHRHGPPRLPRTCACPGENVLGKVGKGLRIALTVLDFGRTTFGASCTGAAKACLRAMATYAKKRVQFEQPLAEFELVKKKIASCRRPRLRAWRRRSAECASFIDRGFEDYMLETAMLKVWSTEALWQIVNDTVQIFGGKAYFTDEPYERMLRDARINQIGEGANDVLRAFIAMVGIKPVADQFLKVKDALSHPLRGIGTLLGFGGNQISSRLTTPDVPVQSRDLQRHAHDLGARVRDFSLAVQRMLLKHREAILFRQYVQERLADAACELYASSCTLSRLDHLLTVGNGNPTEVGRDVTAGRYYLRYANRRVKHLLAALNDNDDADTTATADAMLARY